MDNLTRYYVTDKEKKYRFSFLAYDDDFAKDFFIIFCDYLNTCGKRKDIYTLYLSSGSKRPGRKWNFVFSGHLYCRNVNPIGKVIL